MIDFAAEVQPRQHRVRGAVLRRHHGGARGRQHPRGVGAYVRTYQEQLGNSVRRDASGTKDLLLATCRIPTVNLASELANQQLAN